MPDMQMENGDVVQFMFSYFGLRGRDGRIVDLEETRNLFSYYLKIRFLISFSDKTSVFAPKTGFQIKTGFLTI